MQGQLSILPESQPNQEKSKTLEMRLLEVIEENQQLRIRVSELQALLVEAHIQQEHLQDTVKKAIYDQYAGSPIEDNIQANQGKIEVNLHYLTFLTYTAHLIEGYVFQNQKLVCLAPQISTDDQLRLERLQEVWYVKFEQ